MKVLLINGSPHKEGCTYTALAEVAGELEAAGIETEMIQIGHLDIRGCIACGSCKKTGKCAFDDIVNEVNDKLREADGLVLGSPVYFAGPNATIRAFMDRLFYSIRCDLRAKVGASVVSCRRGGSGSAFDSLNKYFTITGMPVVSSNYWNAIHGNTREEALQDLEGLQTMRMLGRNMAFLIRSIALGKEKYGLPEKEKKIITSYIR